MAINRALTIVPAQAFVTKHVRDVYSCRHCQANEIETPVKTASMPKPAFPNSLALPPAVAYIMNAKFVEGLPFYRQEQVLARLGLELSRQTMVNWMIWGADYLKIVYDRLKVYPLERDILHADESMLQVLQEEGRTPQSKSYIWVYRFGRDGPPIILFEYQRTRAAEHPKEFLKDFNSHLNTDCFSSNDCLEWVTFVACWSHARRGFTDALKALSPQKQKKAVASEGLKFCDELFRIERELKGAAPEERKKQRLGRSVPLLEDFKVWLTVRFRISDHKQVDSYSILLPDKMPAKWTAPRS